MKTFDEFISESTRKKGKRYDSRMNFDSDSSHPDINIKKHSDTETHIHDTKSGITYKVGHYPKNYFEDKPDSAMHDDRPTHSISWDHEHNKKDLSSDEKKKVLKRAADVFHTHVKPRIPSGHLVQNTPMKNYTVQGGEVKERNARAGIYRRHGFGSVGKDRRTQYSVKIGNKLHPVNNTGERKSNQVNNTEVQKERQRDAGKRKPGLFTRLRELSRRVRGR